MAVPPQDKPGGASPPAPGHGGYWAPPSQPPPGYWAPPPQAPPGYWAPPTQAPPGYWAPPTQAPPGYWAPGGWAPGPLPKGGTGRTGPLPLHPMSLGDILDASFKLLRANFLTVAGIVAVLVVPLQLASAIAQRNLFGGHSIISAFNDAANGVQPQTQDTSSVASSISSLVMLLVVPFAAGAISKVVAGSYLGEDVGAWNALGSSARRSWALLLAWIMVHLMEWISGVALILPGLLVMALCVAVSPAIVLERLGPIRGIRRSWRLNRPRMWNILGICIVTGLIFYITAAVIALPLEAAAFAMGLHWGWILLFAAGVFSSLVSVPLTAIVATLIYFDGRIRNEGFDLQAISHRLNASP